MDTQIDIEVLRAKLKAMSRAQALEVAKAAGLATSTVEKFRLNRIAEPRMSKLKKLSAAVRELELQQAA